MRKPAAVAALCWGLALLPGCGHTAAPPPISPADRETGAVDSLPAGTMEERHVQDIAELLQGQVPGLRVIRLPNGDISLRIRGGDVSLRSGGNESTIVGEVEGEPLLVIDGMPVSEGQLSNTLRALNPKEVESIQVLKDVSSTSIYGIRGAHGVILITLKRD